MMRLRREEGKEGNGGDGGRGRVLILIKRQLASC